MSNAMYPCQISMIEFFYKLSRRVLVFFVSYREERLNQRGKEPNLSSIFSFALFNLMVLNQAKLWHPVIFIQHVASFISLMFLPNVLT